MGSGDRFEICPHPSQKDLQGFPGAAAQIGKELSVVEKVTAQDLRNAEDKMPVGNLLKDIRAEPFPELQRSKHKRIWCTTS
jgi:hypothetical protein